jgi:hypothetical protein
VEDDHVDRPGVEVRQRMKLTGTNSSIGLIVLILCAHRKAMVGTIKSSFSNNMRFADLVVLAGWLHPFPFRTRP